MKTAVIIPIHKQLDNVKRILHGLEKQTDQNFTAYFMLDRPTTPEIDEIMKIVPYSKINTFIHGIGSAPKGVINRTGASEIFLTPYIRNEGIKIARMDGCDNFIFIDGDCVPQENLVRAHVEKASYGLPVLSVGRRREVQHGWKDQREIDRSLSMLGLFRPGGMVINNLQMLKNSIVVWSCNVSMNLAAVELLEKFNEHYYGISETFSSLFTGTWGGEDGFLGIEAYYAGVYINMLGDTRAGIKHIDHPRPVNKYGHEEHMRYLTLKTKELGEMMIKRPLPLEFFIPRS